MSSAIGRGTGAFPAISSRVELYFFALAFFLLLFGWMGWRTMSRMDTVCLEHYAKFGYLIVKLNSCSPRTHWCCSGWVMI